ncbi:MULTISPECIES: S8 family serine peptidase [unclassified Streptomyces]|uniref:S8 family serine peptidase n=1 Tax=unclassified Streptomyces TaxID=2593676 RepID=UPI0036E2871F
MRRFRQGTLRRTAALVSALVTVGAGATLPAAAAPTASDSAAGQAAPAAAQSTTVTLITGDVAVVRTDASGHREVSLRSPEGEAGITTVREMGDQLFAIPEKALPLIADGTLDERLFDVDRLIKDGYDDAHSDALPVIVTYGGAGTLARRAAEPVPEGATRTRSLPVVGGSALDVGKKNAAEVWKELTEPKARAATAVERIWLDGKVSTTAALPSPTVPLTGATQAWKKGYDGKGVKVAVLDTGYDADHPDLAGRVSVAQNFTTSASSDDKQGHGTHTLATVGGSGAASDGTYAGEAPAADLMVGKVLDDSGSGLDSWIIAGMQWAVDNGAQVVSMSLGHDGGTCEGPSVDAVQELSDRALFVIAAGNSGRTETVSAPGCAPAALTVGAIDREDATASFSSRGPAVGTHRAKPDIAAPGVDVVSARAGGSGTFAYTTMSGTSMATPHVAGAAAILAQRHPDWTPAQLKTGLVSSVKPSDAPVLDQGAGPMDVNRAVDATVTGPGTTELGDFAWPHTDQEPRTTQVALTNTADRAVSLKLSLDMTGSGGGRLPHGTAQLGARSVTVPAGGTAQVPVTVDPSAGGLGLDDYGMITGRLVGTSGGGVRVTVPVAAYLEPKTVTLTVRGIDRFGNPAVSPGGVDITNLDRTTNRSVGFSGGDLTVQVLAGTYSLAAFIPTRDNADNDGLVKSLSFSARPETVIDKDTTIVFDARKAEKISVSGDRPMEAEGLTASYARAWGTSRPVKLTTSLNAPGFVDELYAEPSSNAKTGTFAFSHLWRMYAPRATLAVDGSALTYETASTQVEFDGTGSAGLVDAGDAVSGLTGDLTGKIAVVTSRPQQPNDYVARDAQKLGAIGVVIGYPDHPGRWDYPSGASAIPLVQLETQDFAVLKKRLAAGPATLTWKGTARYRSPYVYNLVHTEDKRVKAKSVRVRDRELGKVSATWYGQRGDYVHTDWVSAQLAGSGTVVPAGTDNVRIRTPMTREEFYTADDAVLWTHRGSSTGVYGEYLYDGPRSYRAGRTTETDWYKGVLRPVVPSVESGVSQVANRVYDDLYLAIPTWGDSAGHDGAAGGRDSSYLNVTADGVPVYADSETGAFAVPSADSAIVATRTVQRYLSFYPGWSSPGAATTTWSFRSSLARGQGVQPLLFPSYDVKVDGHNLAPADAAFRIGLGADTQPGSPAGQPAEVSVRYAVGSQSSVAEIADWKTARVTRAGKGWSAEVDNTAAAGSYVSLEVTMTDSAGNRVKQTVVRAYGVN